MHKGIACDRGTNEEQKQCRDGADGQEVSDAEVLEGVNVGAIGKLGWGEAMPGAVAILGSIGQRMRTHFSPESNLNSCPLPSAKMVAWT